MEIKSVRAVYFSANGTTEKVTRAIAEGAARSLDTSCGTTDFTLPSSRNQPLLFQPDELIVLGIWISAGRIPNLLLPFLEGMKGNGAIAVPVVLFGNRGYDDGLIELRDILLRCGATPVAAAAFVGEHSFSPRIATERPDAKDLDAAITFGHKVADMILKENNPPVPVQVPGIPYPYRGYYQPLDEQGSPVRFLKAVPVTTDACIDCKLCADICPMGAIDRHNVSNIPGKCIKCCACIRQCPVKAKNFADPAFLSHLHMLENTLTRRSEPECYPKSCREVPLLPKRT
jgi:ferredoxin/flavodoxin